jgi:hypothetical protein
VTPVIYLLRADLRTRWRSLVVLVALAAVVVGAALACTAGARRTRGAFDRYIGQVKPFDALVIANSDRITADRVADIDGVDAAVGFRWFYVQFEVASQEDFFPTVVPDDDRAPNTYLHNPVIKGRLPDPAQPLEIALSEHTARRLHAGVGDRLRAETMTPQQAEDVENVDLEALAGPRLTFTVVGIVRDPVDIGGRLTDVTITLLTPAFGRTYQGRVGQFGSGVLVDLRSPAVTATVAQALDDIGEVEFDPTLGAEAVTVQVAPTLSAMANGLRIAALVIALAGGVAIALALARAAGDRADDLAALQALGLAAPTLAARVGLPGLLAAATGVFLGGPVAIGASGLFPRGLAGRAEPDPGIRFDSIVLVPGVLLALMVVVLVAGSVAVFTVRRQRATDTGRSHPSSVVSSAARLGAPVPVLAGLRLAFDADRGPRGTPVRSALGAAVLGAVGVLATVVFASSLHHAVASPSVYGWSWDGQLSGTNADQITDGVVDEPGLLDDRAFTAVAEIVNDLEVTIEGTPDQATVLDDLRGHVPFVMVSGSEPVGAGEVAVGGQTLKDHRLHIGDSVEVSGGGPARRLRVVGVAVLPITLDGGSSAVGLAMRRPAADVVGWTGSCDDRATCSRNYALVGSDGADINAAALRHAPKGSVEVGYPKAPAEIERLTAVEDLPRLLAVALGVIGIVAVAHAATVTVRRRRRDLAVLRVIGLTRRQLRTTVSVQVLALTLVGTVFGAFLGIVVGRAAWAAVARSTSLPVVTVVPLPALPMVAAVTLLGAHLSASLARRAAGRVRAATALRSE